MSLQKSTSAHPASERQYTAAGEDVPVPWGGGGVFTSDGKRNKEIDARIGKANAVLREFYRSVVTKRELSNTCQFWNRCVSILTYGRESRVVPERVLS